MMHSVQRLVMKKWLRLLPGKASVARLLASEGKSCPRTTRTNKTCIRENES